MSADAPHWRVALDAAGRAGVALRPLEDLEDADRARHLIDSVWGEQVLPRELIRAFQHAGTTLIGAEERDRFVGFVFGFAGLEPYLHVHSHMLAVLPPWRSRGVGFALKLAQRAACLDHGIEEVRWTYDPLVARNARFNLVKLGADAVRLLPAFYGEMTDRLNRGDRSDRFEVRWHLRSDRVERALRGEATRPPLGEPLLRIEGGPDHPEPVETAAAAGPGATVAVPDDHLALRREDPELGRRWRDAAARCFQRCFERGLVAAWMSRTHGYVFQPEERVG